MEVKLISYPQETELIANIAAMICYSGEKDFDTIQSKAKEKPETYLQNIIKCGHLSILEHNIFVFYLSGVSRALTHQLVRKRIASYSQQSQRYVDVSEVPYITPSSIKKSPLVKKYEEITKNLFIFYKEMVDSGIPKEDARYILPNSTTSQLVVSMNAHALIEFFSRRCCVRAQSEIRTLAFKMLDEVKKIAPTLFKNSGAYCTFYGYCPEEGNSCGKAPTLSVLLKEYKQ